jgi:hypothetical protein
VRESLVALLLDGCDEQAGAPVFKHPGLQSGERRLPERCSTTDFGWLLRLGRQALVIVHEGKDASWPMPSVWDTLPPQHDAAETALLGRRLMRPYTDDAGSASPYEAEGIARAIKTYLPAPSSKVGGVPASQLYTRLLQPALAELAWHLGALEAEPHLLEAVVAVAKATPFEARRAYRRAALALKERHPDKEFVNAELIGFIVRRALDGSLPTVKRTLGDVLRQYDKAALASLTPRRPGKPSGRVWVVVQGSEDRPSKLAWPGTELDCNDWNTICNPLELPLGTLEFTYAGSSGKPKTQTITITPTTKVVKLELPFEGYEVSVAGPAPGLKYRLDDEPELRTVGQPVFLKPGQHRFVLEERCEEGKEVTLLVEPLGRADVYLASQPRRARLVVRVTTHDGQAVTQGTVWYGNQSAPVGQEFSLPFCMPDVAIEIPGQKRLVEKIALKRDELTTLEVKLPAPPEPPRAAATMTIAWGVTGISLLGKRTLFMDVSCPPAGPPAARVWGTGPFTLDSGVCAAARFAGKIGPGGGAFRVRRLPGQPSYASARRNGVTTDSFGASSESFGIE